MQRVTDIMAEISAASQEQSAGIEQVNQTVVQMDETTQQNAALVEEATAAARAMEDQAGQLADAVAIFRLDNQVSAAVKAVARARAGPYHHRGTPAADQHARSGPPAATPAPSPPATATGRNSETHRGGCGRLCRWTRPRAKSYPIVTGPREFEFADRDFRRVCDLIYQRVGIALAPAKRDMVYGRLSRRLRTLGMRSFQQYLDHLEQEDGDEWQAFTNALTTNLTSFFREPHHFDKLREELQQRSSRAPLLLWSCAASTGEEPYSMAITASRGLRHVEAAGTHHCHRRRYQVLATAGRGVTTSIASPASIRTCAAATSAAAANEGQCRAAALRELIEFRPLNLLARATTSAARSTRCSAAT